jgi:hypothetical protein
MKDRRLWQGTIIFCLSSVTFSLGHSQTISFNGIVQVGNTINVTGVANETVTIYDLPAKPTNCNNPAAAAGAAPLSFAAVGAAASAQTYTLNSGSAQVTLAALLVKDHYLCLKAAFTPSGGAANGGFVVSAAPVQVQAAAAAPSIAIQGNLLAGATTISVLSSVAADVEIIAFPYQYDGAAPASPCTAADVGSSAANLLQISSGGTPVAALFVPAAVAQTITLVSPLAAGARLCSVAIPTAGAPNYSAFVDVNVAPPGTITLLSAVAMNSNSVTFESDTPGNLSIYLFGAGYPAQTAERSPDAPELACSEADLASGSLLPLVPTSTSSGPSSASTTPSLPVTAKTVTTVALSTPLTANTKICLAETGPSGLPYVAFSQLTPVEFFPPGSDFGRFGLSFTGGVIISNQEQSTASTTASQYLEAELTYDFVRGKAVGLSSFLNFRSSAIPVTATSTTSTPASGSSTTPTLTQSLNALSSQQSVRILAGFLFPFNLTRWYRDQRLTLAPLAVGGFDTLLNPTPPTSTPSTGTSITTAAANFSSVYSYWAGGGELSWVQQPKIRDESERTFAWLSASVGNYSSLPSYICTAKPGSTPTASAKFFSDPANPSTSCLVLPVTPSSGPTSYQVYASRHLIPRLDIAGNLNLPTLPVVLGFDANLGQFEWQSTNLDIVNKPGNDVRLFFGLRFDIVAALGKLGVPTK